MRKLFLAFVIWLAAAFPLAAQSAFWKYEWPDTDFGKTSITDWTEIMSGGPGKDGIPALSSPEFIPAAQDTTLGPSEAVILFQLDGHPARAYPLRYLMWHEIVNDRIGDRPVAVTYCPLCNSALVFDARVGDRVLEFGVSGNLRNSDMVMYDRQTQSWWQQAIGQGIVGEMTGVQLTTLPARMVGWAQFRADHPDGLVMKMPDHPRPYGMNPYRNYDLSTRPFLYNGENPPHGIPPLARVVRVGERAWPLDRLRKAGQVQEAGVTLLWMSGQASALEAGEVSGGRDVGSVRVLNANGGDVVHDVMFAFAFHAFWPDGEWMLGD
ncbi:DUF3179 domain-containing protein [Thalassovita sp.]|uniref:DUF3179 domain-containing protein n=1 Tax=Thalassovita sp. TaxID=1979401 RepID=UPI0029DE889E|nr:DUF3179 domain-containing protein [Thalassovita sp.]